MRHWMQTSITRGLHGCVSSFNNRRLCCLEVSKVVSQGDYKVSLFPFRLHYNMSSFAYLFTNGQHQLRCLMCSFQSTFSCLNIVLTSLGIELEWHQLVKSLKHALSLIHIRHCGLWILQWTASTQRQEFFYLCGATQQSPLRNLQCESALDRFPTQQKDLLQPNVQPGQLMFSLYVVICAGSFLRHAIDMDSLCEHYNLYGSNLSTQVAC